MLPNDTLRNIKQANVDKVFFHRNIFSWQLVAYDENIFCFDEVGNSLIKKHWIGHRLWHQRSKVWIQSLAILLNIEQFNYTYAIWIKTKNNEKVLEWYISKSQTRINNRYHLGLLQ